MFKSLVLAEGLGLVRHGLGCDVGSSSLEITLRPMAFDFESDESDGMDRMEWIGWI